MQPSRNHSFEYYTIDRPARYKEHNVLGDIDHSGQQSVPVSQVRSRPSFISPTRPDPSAMSLNQVNDGFNRSNLPSPKDIDRTLAEVRQRKQQLSQEIIRLQQELSLCSIEIDLLDECESGDVFQASSSSNGNIQSKVETEFPLERNVLPDRNNSKGNDKSNELRLRMLASGVRIFNSLDNTVEGMQYFINNHLVKNDPDDIASFLFYEPRLNKMAIGKHLGHKDNEEVLKAFTKLHDFKGVHLVEALRCFLASFRLPGEGQIIDRMMQAFANHYHSSNPSVLPNADIIHLMAYAIVLLNTSLHNKAVSKSSRMSVDDFIRMVENGILSELKKKAHNSNDNHPVAQTVQEILGDHVAMLQSIYDNVKKQPFKLPNDSTGKHRTFSHVHDVAVAEIFFNPDKEGWLYKLGGNIRSWKRRWFILTGCCLYYFEFSTDKTPKGIIPLAVGLYVREVTDVSKEHCFEIAPLMPGTRIRARKTNETGNYKEGSHSVYRMSACSHNDKMEWIHKLRRAMENVAISTIHTQPANVESQYF